MINNIYYDDEYKKMYQKFFFGSSLITILYMYKCISYSQNKILII